MQNNIKQGLKDGIPIALGYFSVSFTFGMLAVNHGMKPFHAVLISLLNLTSAGQFAGLNVILAGSSLVEMALTQLVINMRYALMSLSLSQKFARVFIPDTDWRLLMVSRMKFLRWQVLKKEKWASGTCMD